MDDLERQFPETGKLADRVEYFELGQEPPGTLTWRNSTPEQRLRAVELLRRINYGKSYDPDAPLFPAPVQIIDRRRR